MTLFEQMIQDIRRVTDQAAKCATEQEKLNVEEMPDYSVEEPKEKSFGDFSVNCAMLLARSQHKAPREIAQILTENMDFSDTYIKSAEVAGAGFINFRLDPAYLTQILQIVETQGDRYGENDYGHGERINVEFVSANPTGPMHMGNARGGALGDVLANVLSLSGYDVTKEFYVNDAGNQIEKLAVSLLARYRQCVLGEDAVVFPEDGYHGEDVIAHARNFYEQFGDSYIDRDEEEVKKKLIEETLYKNIDGLKSGLADYRIFYDVWFHESKLHEENAVMETVRELTERGYTYEQDGAIWFRATDFGLEKDDVLVRANGFVTYFAADIAYHKNKLKDRNFDLAIDIWGADHHGHVARLKAAMEALGIDPNRLEIILMQLVRLVRDGEAVRMSKRTGKAITLGDLLEETGVDAARFFFNMRQPNSHFDFDLELAARQSSENPVFYVQYAHARICGIIKVMAEQGLSVLPYSQVDVSKLTHEKEMDLMRMIARFPEEVRNAAIMREPNKITKYTEELAGAFHAFYSACKVNCEDRGCAEARLFLTAVTGQTIKNALHVLGITAPEHM